MGQKINVIALRIGRQNAWWISNSSAKNEYVWLWINRIITGVLKRYNIMLSELVVKYNDDQTNNSNDVNKKSLDGEHTGQWESIRKLEWLKNYKESEKNQKFEYKSELPGKNKTSIKIYGLVYNPTTSVSDKKRMMELNSFPEDNWDGLITLIRNSKIQSGRSQILLEEIVSVIGKILEIQLNKPVDIKLEQVKSPKSNSVILSNWVELGLLESDKILNDKKIMKLLLAPPAGVAERKP